MSTNSNKYFIFKKKSQGRLKLSCHFLEEETDLLRTVTGLKSRSWEQSWAWKLGTQYCTALPPPFPSLLNTVSQVHAKEHQVSAVADSPEQGVQAGEKLGEKRQRKDGREGGTERERDREGKRDSFPLDGSIFCLSFRIRCKTGH